MKKLGFISWYAILASTSITAYLDWESVVIVRNFGGFGAWQTNNPYWDLALAYLTMWHIFYIFCMWIVYVCNKD